MRCWCARGLALLMGMCATAGMAGASDADIWRALEANLAKAHIPPEAVSLVVQSVDGGPPRLRHNADQAMQPASVMKLVTSVAALHALGPAYRWKTEVYALGQRQHDVLTGDLIFKGGGDPALDVPAFWQLLQQIQQQGIRHVHGQLRIDNSLYDPAVSQRPAFDAFPSRAYNANPSALLLNGRHTSFRFQLLEGNGNPQVTITQAFPLPQITVINQLVVRQGPCGDWKEGLQVAINPSEAGVSVTFSGAFPNQCTSPRYLELSVLSDTQYIAYTFRQLWQSLGGTWTGQAELGVTPATATLVTTWLSPPLDQVLRDINKWSNNVMARSLLLSIGVNAGMVPVDEASAALALKQTLRMQGLAFPELVIENGAGLSRNERISAQHLADMLVRAYQAPSMPILLASLPIVGVDGTTQKRLTQRANLGRAYLKTGSIQGVSSLAGYLQDLQGKRYVFVMLVNHPNAAASRASQDALLSALIETP